LARASRQGTKDSSAEAVATVVYSARALEHLERAFEAIARSDPSTALDAATAIQSAVSALAAHPLIGRRIEREVRELVISFGKSGYVALYRFVPHLDAVRVLAIRHQRELDYPD
jgi:plasmid stabilization system protein ParE